MRAKDIGPISTSSPFHYLRLGPYFILLPEQRYSSFLTDVFFTLEVKNIKSSLSLSSNVTSFLRPTVACELTRKDLASG
uniref:Uncharacterized protein n=1 Tax=Picea glauca TaxID=3330 RepID=A0A101LTY1_PICGL|nr:hypothetical protein ABT39_MTgene3475 [Picea glauca]QHR91354.1 hypothetical protein Q903MT_gene5388 [Picea sitchensis]